MKTHMLGAEKFIEFISTRDRNETIFRLKFSIAEIAITTVMITFNFNFIQSNHIMNTSSSIRTQVESTQRETEIIERYCTPFMNTNHLCIHFVDG